MSWYIGSIPINNYTASSPPVVANYLLMTDNTPLLLTDMTGMLLAG